MHNAVSDELRVFKPRYHRKNSSLFREFEMRLKSHKIIHRRRCVVFSQLNDRIRRFARFGIGKSHRLERTEKKRVFAPERHCFNRHAAFEYVVFKIAYLSGLCRYERLVKRFVFLFRHRTVYIIGRSLAVARREICLGHINAFSRYYRRRGVEKMKSFCAEKFRYFYCERF